MTEQSQELKIAIKQLYYKGLSYSFVNVIERDGDLALKYLLKSGQAGYGDAYFMIGQMYLVGVGVGKNRSKARDYFNLAVQNNSAKGHFGLAEVSYEPSKISTYMKVYDELFAEAHNNDEVSQFLIALYFAEGLGGVEVDKETAFYWMKESADRGMAEAQYQLGTYYEKGIGCEIDFESAYRYYCDASIQGNVDALYAQAICVRDGKGIIKDEKEAVILFTKASELGKPEAQFVMGEYYLDGRYFQIDKDRAYSLFTMSASQGCTMAQNSLAKLFTDFDRQEPLSKIIAIYKQAVANGDATAQYNLGMCHLIGKGMPVDYVKASELFRMSSAQGNEKAMYRLAIMYLNGQGVEKDYSQAVQLLTTAVIRGDKMARLVLSDCYEKGIGTPCDRNKAQELKN